MFWFSKKEKAQPPVYFTIGSHQPPATLDRSAVYQMAFTILITLLEKEGPASFGKIVDSLYIGFSKRGPVVTALSIMQQEPNLIGYAKLSEIPGVVTVNDKVNYYGDLLTSGTAELLLQREFMQAAEQITGEIFGKNA